MYRHRNPHNKSDILIYRYGADPFDNWNQTTPGPLTVLINAMLGEESWFHAVVNATNVQEERDAFVSACVRGLPLSTYTGYFHNGFASANFQCSFLGYPDKIPISDSTEYNLTSLNRTDVQIVGDMSRMVAEWFSGFVANASTEDALEAGMYLANEALLTVTADASKVDSARPIYLSRGTLVVKPDMRNPSKAVVSFLMLAEIVGLLWLAWSSYRMPTFAARFDAIHVATIGAQLTRQMGVELPGLGLRPRGLARLKYLKKLEDADGLIGVQEEIELTPLTRSSAISPRTSSTLTPGPSLHYPQHTHTQPHGASTSSPPPSPSVYDAHHMHRSTPSGSHASLSFTPRPVPRVNSYASSSHTNDDIISALDAVSEVNDPDGPPKYGDVVQADAERAAAAVAAAAAEAAAAAAQRMKLVVGGPGRITREMARKPPQKKPRRTAYNTRVRTVPRPGGAVSASDSRIRSNRSSMVMGGSMVRSSRTG